MSLWTSLEPASATVDPGGSTTVRLRLRNTGDVVDEYRFEPVGDVAQWTTVEPQVLRLFPGTTGTVELRFSPPRTPDATAGPNPYAVRITPTEYPEATTVPEGNLTITPFTEMRAELVPPTVKGRFRGRPRLAIDNLGNTKLTASLNGSDNGDQLSYDLRPSNVQIEPGRAAFVRTTLKPRKIIWFGTKEQRPYTLSVLRSGSAALPVEGTYVQRGFLPRWLATFFGVIAALALTFAMLWIAHKPAVNSAATEKVVEAGATLTPTPQTTAPLPPPTTAPPATTEAPPVQQKHDSGGGSGGAKSTPKAKPPVDTAATEVLRLAANDPSGRHICYRVYLAVDGWQRPACDGVFAGTTDQNKAIKAVNIAVYGEQGSAGNAFVNDPDSTRDQGTYWPKGWTAIVADGKDNYLGTPSQTAPDMSGFTINVGSGQICRNARVNGTADWDAQRCVGPRSHNNDYNFVGTVTNNRFLVAIKLVVLDPAS